MNDWQYAQKIKALLQAKAWSHGSTEKVFGSDGVYIFAGAPSDNMIPSAFPFVFISIGPGEHDEDSPGFIVQTLRVSIVVLSEGDPLGEQALIGGPRLNSDLGISNGRGLLEVCEQFLEVCASLTGEDGAPVICSAVGNAEPARLGGGENAPHIVVRNYELKAAVTGAIELVAPWRVVVSGSNPNPTITWRNPDDVPGYVHTKIVRKAGSSAPTSITDGTVVYTGTLETYSESGLAAGTYTWGAFAGYSLVGGSTAQRYSAVEKGQYRTKAV